MSNVYLPYLRTLSDKSYFYVSRIRNDTQWFTLATKRVRRIFYCLPDFFLPCTTGFGGLGVACWPLEPKFAGSNPAEAVGFLRAKKSSARLPSEGK